MENYTGQQVLLMLLNRNIVYYGKNVTAQLVKPLMRKRN
uniref:Transposase n=1 Tax=Schistosoma curassoni TaxID=6186 RepID=A0A183KYJ5_9TREM